MGGTPIVFPSWGLRGLADADVGPAFGALASEVDRFLAFELGEMFVPAGSHLHERDLQRVARHPAVRRCQALVTCRGSSSGSGSRYAIATRPDFMVLTGNDLAIDMVVYGSDYLLGLATFAPDWFAARDRSWAAGDARFFEQNDLLQYLGQFAFRDPVPAYRHSAAQFLRLRGWIDCDATHPRSACRPDADREILAELLARAEAHFTLS